MTKMDHRTLRALIGIGLTLAFVLITAIFSIIPSADAAMDHHKKKAVQGSVDLALQQPQANSIKASPASPKPPAPANPEKPAPASPGNQASTLTINLNLKNIPKGEHRADIHQGSCPLNFNLNGKPPVDGPFTPGVTLPLGNVEAKADGTLNKKLTFQVGGNTGIPTTLLQGGWFFCIHTGTLEELQGKTPDELFASLGTFLKTKQGPGEVQQLACQALNGSAGKDNLTIHINGAPAANPPANPPANPESPAANPTPKPN